MQYNIDFEAWAVIEADSYEEAELRAQEIATAMSDSMLDESVDISVVIADDGINEEEEE